MIGRSVSLYVHIPFCISKCTYCDFFSVPCGAKRVSRFETPPLVPDEYIEAVLREAAYVARTRNISAWKTVYVGGGTPSLLVPAQLHSLFFGLQKIANYQKSDEVTVEVNPCDVTAELLAALEDCGVTRISCGIQSLNETALLHVQRRSKRDDALRALELLATNWRGVFSCDMISGLPEETAASFAAGLETLVSFKPHHISLYALTLEKGTPLANSIESGMLLYDFDGVDDMWISGRDFLLEHGYAQYEVSNFCMPGNECVHNSAYWNLDDYCGCGAGATGTFYDDGVRIANTTDIASYISFWQSGAHCGEVCTAEKAVIATLDAEFPVHRERIDKKTASFEFFMMGLRTLHGVCRKRYEAKFGTFPQKAEALFHAWQKTGRAVIRKREGTYWYALTPSGLLFLNEFLAQLL